MKKFLKLATALIIISGVVFNLSGQTIKERIDAAKTVKVYFTNSDIKHNPNTNGMPGSQNKGTGCVNFTQTTPLPAQYTDEVKLVIDLLNKGFNTTAFIAGDISSVPVFESGFQKGGQDWLKLGEPIVFWVMTSGLYTVNNMGLMGEVKLSNSMSIDVNLGVVAITDGKVKSLTSKNLASVYAPSKESKTCADYDYFVKNFPLADYFDKFKESFEKKTADFIEKEMANYDKAMKKKK
ncbi:MAG: hypothetical protein EPN88_02980 [Bacteroidetes bacterium]|nr:MAG: hypothetical protein EPN88_02980 [Bacteroidota bacterium]